MKTLQELNKITLTFNEKGLESDFSVKDHRLKSYLNITTALLYFCQLVIYLSINGLSVSLIVFSSLVILLGILGRYHQKFLPLYNLIMQSLCCYFLSYYVINSDMHIWRAFMNGQTVGSVLLLGSRSFIFDTISILVSQGIIMYICEPPVQNYLDFIQVAIMNILTKYIYYLFARQTFINQRSIDSWYSAIDKLFQNNIIITKFEPRTCNISLHECNEYARRFNIHQSDDHFREFLTKVKLQSEKRSSRLNSTRATANSIDFITLKEYLIQKYYQITTNKRESIKQIGEEFIGYYEKEKQVMKIKMKIGLLFQEEPYLIITFNDRIDEDNIKCLKKEINSLKSLFMISTISTKIKTMEINNCLALNNTQIAKQIALQQYISLTSIEEYIKQIVQKDFIQQLQYNKICMKNLVELIKNVYPQLRIDIDVSTLCTNMVNDLQKVKLTIFYLLNLITDSHKQLLINSPSDKKRDSGVLNSQNSFTNYYSSSNRDYNQISLSIQSKSSFLYDSICFKLKGISYPKSENSEDGQSEGSYTQSAFTEELIVKEIQKESIRYYISQIGPNNNLPEKKLDENENQYTYEFEIFKDIKNLSSKKTQSVSQKLDDPKSKISTFKKENFVAPKSQSLYSSEVLFNQNIRYNKKIIANNPVFLGYCQKLSRHEKSHKVKQMKDYSFTNYELINSPVASVDVIDEKEKEETTSFNFQPQYTYESNPNIPYNTYLDTNNNDLALKTQENI